jgi:hypothetical protein
MGGYVLDLREIDQTQVALVGGKGANLGELSRIEGIRVPAGFCVTTDAFPRTMEDAPSVEDWLDLLSGLKPDDSCTWSGDRGRRARGGSGSRRLRRKRKPRSEVRASPPTCRRPAASPRAPPGASGPPRSRSGARRGRDSLVAPELSDPVGRGRSRAA